MYSNWILLFLAGHENKACHYYTNSNNNICMLIQFSGVSKHYGYSSISSLLYEQYFDTKQKSMQAQRSPPLKSFCVCDWVQYRGIVLAAWFPSGATSIDIYISQMCTYKSKHFFQTCFEESRGGSVYIWHKKEIVE